jgi:hypothetical protein
MAAVAVTTSLFDEDPFALCSVATVVGLAEPPVSETLSRLRVVVLPSLALVSQ